MNRIVIAAAVAALSFVGFADAPAPAPLGMNPQLELASSAFGSSEIAATVTGIGTAAESATLTFHYGTTEDCADGTVTVADVVATGTYSALIPTPTAGATYCVQATLSNDVAEVVTSEIFNFTHAESLDPDVAASYDVPQVSRLPNDYTELPYVIADGGYLDTRICPDTDTRVTATFRTEYAGDKMIYGVRNNGLGWIYWVGKSFGNLYSLVFNGYTSGGTTMSDVEEKSKVSIDVSKNGLLVNGVERVSAATLRGQATGAKSTRSMMLFALRDGANLDSQGRHFEGECYAFTVYTNNDVKAVEYVPAQERGGDRRVGFYDIVNDEFRVSDVANKPFKPGTSEDPLPEVTHTLFVRGAPNEERMVAPAFGEYVGVEPGAALRFATFPEVVTNGETWVCKGYEVYTIAEGGTKTLVASDSEAAFELSMPDADTEVLWKWAVNAPLGMNPQLELASSAFGSSVVAATVTGIGKTATSATLAFKFGATPDCADGTIEMAVDNVGEWCATLPHLIAGQAYYVKAILSNDAGDTSVESDVYDFVQPEVAEEGFGSPGLIQYQVKFTGNVYLTPDNWESYKNGESAAVPGALMAKASNINGTTWKGTTYPFVNYTGYWYEGYMLLEAGKTYSAKSAFDDGGCVYIDGKVVYQQGSASGNKGGAPSVTPVPFVCEQTGWYRLQLGAWDWGGGRALAVNTIAIVQWSDGDPAEVVKNYGSADWHEFWDADADGMALGTYLYTDIPPYPLELKDGQLVMEVLASDAARTAVFYWGETYGGTNDWAYSSEVTVPAGETTVSFPKPTGWGSSVWFARAKVGEGEDAVLSKTQIATDANLPQATLADVRALGLEKFVLSGTLDSFVGESCTVTPVVTDSTGAAIAFSAAAQEMTEPGEFGFTLPTAITAGETYSVCVEMTANGRAARSKTVVVKTGTAGTLTSLAPGAPAPIVVTVEDAPDGLTTVSPVYGRYAAEENKVYTFTATGSQTIDGRAYALLGYEVYDDGADEPVTAGEGDTFTFASDRGGFRVVWIWDVDYLTTVEVSGGNGSAVASRATVKDGETARFTATPDVGYAVAWTGDVPNEQMFGNELVLNDVQGPVHVIASFFVPSENAGEKAGLFADYAHSQSIDFAGYAGETALADFPALIRLTEGKGGFSYADCAFADGRDVRFCGADGQELASEVASWNSNGTSEFWVKVPSLTKSTRIHLVWGNANAPKRTPGTYAFNEGYRGVWTMEPAKNVLLDRSTYGQHAACFEEEVTSVSGGVVGGARRFSGTERCYAYLGLGSAAFMEPKEFTAECWFKVANYPTDWTYFLASGTRDWNNTSKACTFGIDSEGRIFGSNNGAYVSNVGNRKYPWSKDVVASKGEWHHAAYTQAANGEEFIYLDGVMVGAHTNVMADIGWGEAFYYDTSDWRWARQGNPTLGGWWPYASKDNYRYFAGDMDEARLSSEVRSADWVRATYQTVAEGETFAVFGRPVYKLTVDGVAQPVAPEVAAETPAVVEANGVKTTYLGYELVADGTCVASGEGLSVSRAWPKDAHAVAVRWLRKVEYKVNDDYVEPGSLVRVTAPDAPAGQAFHSWGGDCPTLEVFTASFDLPADRPRTLTPNYAPLTEVTTNGCADADEAGMVLKSAIDAAVAAGTPQVVLVDDGVYAISNVNALTISSPVVIRSKNGFEKTVLLQLKNPAANNPAWTMITVSNPGALLEGLDFQCYGGYGGAYAGVANVTEGHFSNCRFILQSGRSFGAINGPRFVAQSGGWCRNCVFTAFDDITRSYDSGAAGVFDHMIMDSCVITNLRTSSAYNYVISPICAGLGTLVRNTLVAKNHAQSSHNGGAVSMAGSSAKGIVFENCTIADNNNVASSSSTAKGGGIYTDYPLLVVNTILSGNKANSMELGDDFYGPVGAVCSMSKDFSGGEFGSMTALPAYQTDEAGVPDTVLYRTRGVSPSRDAGYPTVWSRTPGAWDLLGTNRVAEAEVDIGACEYAPTEDEEFDVSVRIEGDFTQRDRVEATFVASVSGAKGEVTYDWDFGDGGTSSEANPVYTYTKPGWYTVKLTVTDEKRQTKTFQTTDPVKVRTSVCYINSEGSGTPPYATRETGANGELNFADALSDQPSTIIICSNTVARNFRGSDTKIAYPVTIVGEDRETSTMNYRANFTGPGVVLSTITYTGGDGSYSGLSASKALVTNVVFRNTPVSGDGYALKADEGTRIVDSVFVNINPNHASGGTGSAALMIVGKDVVVERCVVTNNFSASSAGTYAAGIRVTGAYDPMPVVRNSFIGYNRCFDTATRMNAVGGAGIYTEGPVRVENCTIVSNQTCGAGSAVYIKSGAAEIVNTIIACNAGGLTNAAEICSNEVYVAEGASVTWTKCRVPAEAGIDDAGVTTADPMFNFGARTSVPYWGILGDSPLKNKGVKRDWMTPEAKDLGGQKRVFNAKPDLGCYESQVGGTVIIVR